MESRLPPDFREFLLLLNSEQIDYLLVGGYAVSFHGYPRPTGDLDIWVAMTPVNATRLATALGRFGFAAADAEVFMTPRQIVRMGVPPVRIEILNEVSGVTFESCRARCEHTTLDGVPVKVISRADLLANKRAAGRQKDLNDVQHLEQGKPKNPPPGPAA
jgi:predicted nucleotidyltransferase